MSRNAFFAATGVYIGSGNLDSGAAPKDTGTFVAGFCAVMLLGVMAGLFIPVSTDDFQLKKTLPKECVVRDAVTICDQGPQSSSDQKEKQ